ncbi:MAG: hypothetical protein Q4E87_08260, partial [bacterium]|nr:hypothetical protein [bacterium]
DCLGRLKPTLLRCHGQSPRSYSKCLMLYGFAFCSLVLAMTGNEEMPKCNFVFNGNKFDVINQ